MITYTMIDAWQIKRLDVTLGPDETYRIKLHGTYAQPETVIYGATREQVEGWVAQVQKYFAEVDQIKGQV